MSIGINIFPQGSNSGGGGSSVLVSYKGSYNASTNTPTLANGTGTLGDWYSVSVGGTNNPTGTNIPAGHAIYYNGSSWVDYGPNPNSTDNYVIPAGFTPITGQDVQSGDNVTTAFEKVQGQLNQAVVNWASTITFDLGDATWYNGYLWYSLIANNTNNQPNIISTQWARQLDTNIYFTRTIINSTPTPTIVYSDDIVYVNATSADITVTLSPIATLWSVPNTEKQYQIRKIDNGTFKVIIKTSGSDTFVGGLTSIELIGQGTIAYIGAGYGLTYFFNS